MKTQKVYLDYLPEYDTYGISDEKIKQLTEAGITPILELAPEDAKKLSAKQKDKNILCIQWHPEDFAAKGDKKMQSIYNWLFGKAKEHQQKQQFKNMMKQQLKNFTRG